jgi:hypothetical protein
LTYNSGTGVLTVDIKNHTGSGTYTSWVVNVGGVTPVTSVAWGAITGTLSSQTDLNTALSGKAPLASPTFTGNVTITTNSASPALIIVQDGAGDVVQFKDVSSDTTYSFINASGKVNTIASTTANAGLNIPQGTAPTSPVNGDMWTTTSNLLVRINGITQTIVSSATLASYAPLASPLFTGDARCVTPATSDSDTSIATTAFVKNQLYLTAADAVTTYLPLAGGTLTGPITVGPILGFTTTIDGYGITFDGGLVINQEETHITGFNINLPASGTITNCGSISFADFTTQTTAGIPDAPSDGSQYARQNATWQIVSGGGGGGLTITTLSNSATSTLNAGVPTAGQALTYDGIDLTWATVSGSAAWGAITGTLSSQTDLQGELDLKAPLVAPSFTSGITVDGTISILSPSTSATFNYLGLDLGGSSGGITFADATVQTTAAGPAYTADNAKADAVSARINYFPYYSSNVQFDFSGTAPVFINALFSGSWGIFEAATSTYYSASYVSGSTAYFSGSWGGTGPFYVQVNGTNSFLSF